MNREVSEDTGEGFYCQEGNFKKEVYLKNNFKALKNSHFQGNMPLLVPTIAHSPPPNATTVDGNEAD